MKAQQQRQWDSLHRAKDLLDANAAVIGGLAQSAGKQQLDRAVANLAAFSNEQDATTLEIAGHLGRQGALVKALRTEHMQPIAIFARARLRGAPDFAALTRSTAGLQVKPLVRAARAMATAAAPHVDDLVAGGFAATAVTALAAAADAVETAQLDRANARVRRIGATKGVEQELQAGREAVSMLHAVIRSQHSANPTFLAAWDAARRVTMKVGPARVPASAAPAPVMPPVVASAGAVTATT